MKLPPIPTSLFLLFSSRIVGVIALPPRNYGVGSNDAIPQEMDISLGYDVAMWIAQWYFCPNCVTRCDTPSAPLIGPPVIVGRVEKALKTKPKDFPREKCSEWCTAALNPTLKWQLGEWTGMLKKNLAGDPRRKTLSKISHEASKKLPGYQCTGDDLNFLVKNPNASPLFANGQPRYAEKRDAIKTVRPQRSGNTPARNGQQAPSGQQQQQKSKGSTNTYQGAGGDQSDGRRRASSSSSSPFPGSNRFFSAVTGAGGRNNNPLEMRVSLPSQGDVQKWVSGGVQGAQRAWTNYQQNAGPAAAAWMAGGGIGGGGGGGGIKAPGGSVPFRVIAP